MKEEAGETALLGPVDGKCCYKNEWMEASFATRNSLYHIDPQRKTYTTALVYWTWLNKNKQYFVA